MVFFLLFFFKFYFIFKLYIIVLVLPYIKMNLPQVYMCSPSWTLFPPPSPFHPSGSSQCTSPSFFQHLRYVIPLPLASIVCSEKSAVNLIKIPLYMISSFSVTAFKTHWLSATPVSLFFYPFMSLISWMCRFMSLSKGHLESFLETKDILFKSFNWKIIT